MFNNLKLKEQLSLGYAIPVVLWLIMAGIVYVNARTISETLEEIERVQKVFIQETNIALSGERMVRSLRGYMAIQNPDFLDEYNAAYEAAQKAATNVTPLIKDESQKKRLELLMKEVDNYNQYSKEIISLMEKNNKKEVLALFQRNPGKQFVDTFARVNEEFMTFEADILKKKTDASKGDLQQMLYDVIIGVIILIVIALVTIAWISLGVTQKINRTASGLALSSSQISTTLVEQERSASQQATSVNETTTTMDELGASARATSEQAEAAAVAARQVLGLAEGGKQTVSTTLGGMANLKEKVNAISQQIMHLSEQTNQIGNISQLVSELANQTNMLALNATVEAVRAGEHGKGFAVVAAEIRRLADESKKSAQKINTIVDDIQGAINTTIMVTDEGTKTVETGVRMAEKTAETFSNVTDSVNNVVVNSQQISLNVKQQAIAINQLVSAMSFINSSAKENADSLKQLKQGIDTLNDAAMELKSVV